MNQPTRTMRIDLTRLTPPYHFRATDELGQSIEMDGPGADAVPTSGISPMLLLIMAMGGCSGIDIALILDKQKQTIETFDMELDAERPEEPGCPFSRVHAHYILTGEIDPKKAIRAVRLSITKYCGVSRTLAPTTAITATVSVNGERHHVDLP